MNDSKEFLTCKEACILINLKLSRIRNLIFRKEIPHYKIGTSIRFEKDELLHWLESQKVISNKQR